MLKHILAWRRPAAAISASPGEKKKKTELGCSQYRLEYRGDKNPRRFEKITIPESDKTLGNCASPVTISERASASERIPRPRRFLHNFVRVLSFVRAGDNCSLLGESNSFANYDNTVIRRPEDEESIRQRKEVEPEKGA